MSYWPLAGVAVVVAGFAFRINPILVVVAAAIATGLLAGVDPLELLRVIGTGFLKGRFLLVVLLALPVIGLAERAGLRERAAAWVARLRGATAGRVLIGYLALRQFTAMIGLTSLGGQAQTVRPLLSPMAEAAAELRDGPLEHDERQKLRALCAATDNVALFFGEDVFLAFGAVLLIQAFLASQGIALEPIQIALWGLPTAVAAFTIHAWRLVRRDRKR